MNVIWHFHPDNEIIQKLKKAYRNRAYLEWLRKQKCWSCPARLNITASHIFRGYHGLKNHDWASVPQCGWCHWEYEYHRDKFMTRWRLPSANDAEKYFQRFLQETNRVDDRNPDQLDTL